MRTCIKEYSRCSCKAAGCISRMRGYMKINKKYNNNCKGDETGCENQNSEDKNGKRRGRLCAN